MSAVAAAQELVDALTDARAAAWKRGRGAASLETELELAWQNLRKAKAEAENGGTEEIIRRARVERELEKLMLQDEELPESVPSVEP